MPDLDDIFEEIVDIAKKFRKKQKRKYKNGKKRDKDTSPKKESSILGRFLSTALAPQTTSKQPAHVNSTDLPNSMPAVASSVKNAVLQDYLTQARSYEHGILELMRNAPTEFNRDRMEELSRYIDHWRRSLEALVERVDRFQQNDLLQRDLDSVPKAIERLEEQLESGAPEKISGALRRTLSNRQNQLASLKQLEETMQWAEVKIENTVSMLGTLYSQAMMSQSKGQVGSYRRLLAEIEEESLSLDDYVATLKEIKFGESI